MSSSAPAPVTETADGAQPSIVVALSHVSKQYPGVRALHDVSLDLRRGEVHALIGENGAGKSTLIRVLSGDAAPDAGSVSIDGRPVAFDSPLDARKQGIVTIFQELMIVPELSVAENIFLGNEPLALGCLYSRPEAERRTRQVLETLVKGSGIRPAQRAAELSTAQKQLVEIARALVFRASVIIMDEPTAALSEGEAASLRRLILRLIADGVAILFVSHRLDEVMEIADRVTVLRGGQHIATLDAKSIADTDELIGLMVGRPITELFPPRNAEIGEVVLRATGLTRVGPFEDVSFTVRAGEVVGFAGLVGAGRTETMRGLFGAERLDRGELYKRGAALDIRTPRDAIAAGIAYLPEDRKEQGLVLSMSGVENIAMASLEDYCIAGVLSWRSLRATARAAAQQLQFRGQLEASAATASGGNQQKLVIAKWARTGADILIFDEPTRGIDVGAKAEVYRLIHQLAGEGAAIIVVSSELPELMNVCHRIYTMSGGRIRDEVAQSDFSEHRILEGAFAAHLGAGTSAEVRP
ncbi:sugar ABC transporter ATP-binding protein [Bradyrhizobium sp. Leo170]|uniref:sugar ABC transporter ATP-binding protein n=1 Tax=Bradyrhizobium sp. Leo170 TaxID=1571199 RepID=UPI00102E5D54|nr:sugar ABC transporter ATP-binding protein [Bradyrhizobium sp. Leo170]TAI63491.1 D-xylose ABC transporter ATP-binding protein [Bradyrhizobium sp. Leo170]